MSLKDCIGVAISKGDLTKKAGEDFLERMQKQEEMLIKQGRGGIDDYIMSVSREAEALLSGSKRNKDAIAKSILIVDRNWEVAGEHSRGRFFGLLAMVGENLWGKGAPYSIPARSRTIYGIAQSFMSDSLPAFRSTWAGLKAGIEIPNKIVDEVYGTNTGNALAKAGAEGYKKAVTYLMQSLKDAGVSVHEVSEWFLPQRFDPGSVKALGLTKFTDTMMERWHKGDLKLQNWSAKPKEELIAELDPKKAGLNEIQAKLNEETPEIKHTRDQLASKILRRKEGLAKIQQKLDDPKVSDRVKKASEIQRKKLDGEMKAFEGQIAALDAGRSTNVSNKAGFDKTLDPDPEDPSRYLVPGEDDLLARQIFHKAFINIESDGAALMRPGEFMSTTLADKYAQRRAFEWSSAEAWKKFNDDMGVSSAGVGDLLIRHLQELSRDLAIAQTLGPRPDLTMKLLLQTYRVEGGSKWGAHVLDATWYHSSGMSASPVSEKWAMGMQAFRSHLTAAQLPTAILSAVSDLAFTRSTAAWNGLPSTRFMSGYLKGMTNDPLQMKEMLSHAFVLEDGLRAIGDMTRDSVLEVYARSKTSQGVETGLSALNRFAGKEAEVVLRAQGLIRHTQKTRDNLSMSFIAGHGAMADLTLDQMRNARPNMAAFFDTYGISGREWDMIRSYKQKVAGGQAEIIAAGRMARETSGAKQEAAIKYLSGITSEAYMGAPESNTVMRGIFLAKTNPGSPMGELARTGMMYKGFPIAVMLMHGLRSVDGLADLMTGRGGWSRGMYGAALLATMVPLGAMSVQLSNMIAGKNPEPMDNPGFWGRAAVKAGVAGIMGDWIKAAIDSGSSGELASRILVPPPVGAAVDVATWGTKNTVAALTPGKQSHFAYDGVRLLDRYTPDTLWTKNVMDRMVFDTLKKMVDPAAAMGGFARLQTQAAKEQGTTHWYAPGHLLPSSAPNADRVLGR